MAQAVQASDKIIRFIGGHEGKVLKAYRDPVHIITIGYGFTWASSVFREWWMANRGHKLRMGDTMTEVEALHVLELLVAKEYGPPVDKKFAGRKAQVKDPAKSMVFNCGPGALSWSWANFIAQGKVKEGIARWRTTGTTAKGKKLPGLVRRRNEEADIAEFNRWPSWLGAVDTTAIETHTDTLDIAQAQRWLEELGYSPGPADGIMGIRTTKAARRFQQDHGQLKVDGIIGPATLSALQRSIDLKKKAGGVTAGAGGAVAGGAAENATGAGEAVDVPVDVVPGDGISEGHFGWIGDVLIWGGIAFFIVALVWLAWRYKDEINAVLRRLA